MIEKIQSGQVNLLLLLAIFFGIGTVLFGALAVVAFNQRNQSQATIDNQITRAVTKAKADQKKASDEQHAKENQLPYRTYTAAQADGAFQLQIPKNWSLYAERANVGQTQLTLIANLDAVTVNKGGNNTQPFKLQLLRQTALDVVKKYQQDIKTKKIAAKTVKVSGIDATQLEGVLDTERHDGVMIIVPVRDKALVFVTESRSYVKEFSEIVGTAKINP
jgi:hypothetical protein